MQLFLFLVITHFITDFLLQRWGIGENKRGFNKFMFAHILITTLLFTLVNYLLGVSFTTSITRGLVIFVSHFAIDVIRQEILVKFKITTKEALFWNLLGIDQILHVVFIYLSIKFI